MISPHSVLEDAMERGNLPAEIRDELRVQFGYAQLLFCLDNFDSELDPSTDLDDDVERDDRQVTDCNQSKEVLPPGFYVVRDPEVIAVYGSDDLLAFQVTPETSDAEMNALAWDFARYGSALESA